MPTLPNSSAARASRRASIWPYEPASLRRAGRRPQRWGERSERILKHHGDLISADTTHLGAGFRSQVGAFEQDRATGNPRARSEQPHYRQTERALARARLPTSPMTSPGSRPNCTSSTALTRPCRV